MENFEKLTAGVSRIYKSIQRIKKQKMTALGLKGTHVMCIYFLRLHPDGLTAADLCRMCREDKAGISRTLSDLENQEFLHYDSSGESRKYRAKALLTDSGREYAEKINKLIIHATLQGGKGITEEERQVFYRVLFQIADNLEQICMEPEKEGENHA